MVQPLWKTVCHFLKKLSMELPYDTEIPLLDIYPEELKTSMCTQYSLKHYFTVAKDGNIQSMMNGWTDGLYLCNGILCSHKKELISDTCFKVYEF